MVGVGVLMVLVGYGLPAIGVQKRAVRARCIAAHTVGHDVLGWSQYWLWYVTEIGRQPWVVDGLLRTADVVADHSSATVAGTLFGYVLLYLFLLVSYIAALRYMATKPARSLSLMPQQRAMNAERAQGEA